MLTRLTQFPEYDATLFRSLDLKSIYGRILCFLLQIWITPRTYSKYYIKYIHNYSVDRFVLEVTSPTNLKKKKAREKSCRSVYGEIDGCRKAISRSVVCDGDRFDNANRRLCLRLHAWGDTMDEAFEQCAMAMFGYMTDLERVEITQIHHIEAEGDDMESLLFHFLDELLFMFSAEPYIIAKV